MSRIAGRENGGMGHPCRAGGRRPGRRAAIARRVSFGVTAGSVRPAAAIGAAAIRTRAESWSPAAGWWCVKPAARSASWKGAGPRTSVLHQVFLSVFVNCRFHP
jgi:hypothetical protein